MRIHGAGSPQRAEFGCFAPVRVSLLEAYGSMSAVAGYCSAHHGAGRQLFLALGPHPAWAGQLWVVGTGRREEVRALLAKLKPR